MNRPTSSANAGSRLIRVPNAAVFSLRSASSSRVNGTIGSSTASPMRIQRGAERDVARLVDRQAHGRTGQEPHRAAHRAWTRLLDDRG